MVMAASRIAADCWFRVAHPNHQRMGLVVQTAKSIPMTTERDARESRTTDKTYASSVATPTSRLKRRCRQSVILERWDSAGRGCRHPR